MPEPLVTIFALVILYSFVLVEGGLVLIAVKVAKTRPAAWRGLYGRVEKRFYELARRRRLAVVSVGLLALAGRALLAPLQPIRKPLVTDEFSYLLAGDTFASGRLTNPPHPLWKHFESMHTLQRPTYSSMYQPAQGLVLAAGKKIAGQPWYGVWLSMGVMCGAICWMLQGWLPPRWALIGGALVAVRLGWFSYWMNSYWGGAPAATGGALLLGALPRLRKHWQARDALLLALGVAILAASRPFEGAITALPAGALLLVWMSGREGPPLRVALARVVLPVAVVLGFTAVAMAYYFQAVTGSPMLMPQQLQREQYAMAPYFPWQKPRPPVAYRTDALAGFYARWEMQEFGASRSFPGFLKKAGEKLISAWLFFLGPLLTVPLLFLPNVVRNRRLRPLLIVAAVAGVGMALNSWFYAHYAAPLTCIVFALVVQGIRYLRWWRRADGTGLCLARGIGVMCVAVLAIRLIAQPLGLYFPPAWPMVWFHTAEGNVARSAVLRQLSALEGNHLAIVRYGPAHNSVMNEWVYNGADIDHSRVVWARELDAASNRELIRYFHDRRAWLVEADAEPPKVSPYAPVP